MQATCGFFDCALLIKIKKKKTLIWASREFGIGVHMTIRIGRNEKKGKTQEKMVRGSRKRSSSAGSEKMERVGSR